MKTQLKQGTNIHKIYSTLKKRKSHKYLVNHKKYNSYWPTSTSFSLINKLDMSSRQTQFKTNNLKLPFYQQQRHTINVAIKIVDFDRPLTALDYYRNKNKKNSTKACTERETTNQSRIDLSEKLKQQKILKLREENTKLSQVIFKKQNKQFDSLLDEKQQKTNKNAINMKTYKNLNKILNIRHKLHQLTHK